MAILPWKFYAIAMCCAALGAVNVQAQERAAAGALETQMTWSSLKNQVEGLKTQVSGLDTKINMVATCGKQGKVYTPGVGNGCSLAATDPKVLEDITDLKAAVQNMLDCGKRDLVYNPNNPAATKCSVPPPNPLGVFAVRAGFDAGKSMTIKYNLTKGSYVLTEKNFHGNAKAVIPKLEVGQVCAKSRSVDVLSLSHWETMPLAPGKSMDRSVSYQNLQSPSCANGLVGILRIYDDSGSNENNQYSTGAVLLMNAY
ncbi:MAG: hypothetical protein EON60_02045 [Alphaproteobacteria bacterium]|nr:MAG: hypothetical protein EON60_02045 [Alphaproteobacteria bacterium]